MQTAAARIAAFVARSRNLQLSPAQRHLTYRALLDTIAVSIAGRSEEAVRIARRYVSESVGAGSARAWMDDALLPSEHAAWLNGICSHVLDYDDVMAPMRGHVSVAVIPALLALAPEMNATGRDYAVAYATAFEVLARLSRVMAFEHYAKGWHSTSALGVIGAAAACSSLLKLTERQTINAIGLAVAQAAGTRQNFGTMAKSFQIGECARAAIRSVLLARAGFDAASDSIDGPFGYIALYGAGQDVSDAFDGIGTAPLELDRTGIEVKKYPCCYATHQALDAVLSLRQAHALDLQSVARIEIVASAGALEPLIRTPPTSGLTAKFSLEYTVAAALQDGAVGLSTFDDAQAMRPEVMAFLPNVATKEDGGPPRPRWTRVRIFLHNGTSVEKLVDTLRGGAADPLSDEELVDKVQDSFAFTSLDCSARAFAAKVFAMDDVPVDQVLHGLHCEAGGRASPNSK
jgi:2-methylcitrate dehydratase PrpD